MSDHVCSLSIARHSTPCVQCIHVYPVYCVQCIHINLLYCVQCIHIYPVYCVQCTALQELTWQVQRWNPREAPATCYRVGSQSTLPLGWQYRPPGINPAGPNPHGANHAVSNPPSSDHNSYLKPWPPCPAI